MERLQTFADIFGLKDLQAQSTDDDTATVQSMMRRVLFPADGTPPMRCTMSSAAKATPANPKTI